MRLLLWFNNSFVDFESLELYSIKGFLNLAKWPKLLDLPRFMPKNAQMYGILNCWLGHGHVKCDHPATTDLVLIECCPCFSNSKFGADYLHWWLRLVSWESNSVHLVTINVHFVTKSIHLVTKWRLLHLVVESQGACLSNICCGDGVGGVQMVTTTVQLVTSWSKTVVAEKIFLLMDPLVTNWIWILCGISHLMTTNIHHLLLRLLSFSAFW